MCNQDPDIKPSKKRVCGLLAWGWGRAATAFGHFRLKSFHQTLRRCRDMKAESHNKGQPDSKQCADRFMR